jgi:hypothetical protein
MRTYNCDRCGEQMPGKEEPCCPSKFPLLKERLKHGATLSLPILIEDGFDLSEIDLCLSCVESLWKWLSKK